MTVEQIENELKKIPMMPSWGRKQCDHWDRLSNFVYRLPSYENLKQELLKLNNSADFNNYVLHRWYNTLSAFGVEKIFATLPNVQPNKNKYDKLIDFTLGGINFDHKTTVFPKKFGKPLDFAKQNPLKLIEWLYAEQSMQNRFHESNRLFLVLHRADGEHWKLRAELSLIQPILQSYGSNFHESCLHALCLKAEQITYADIIWVCQ